MKAFEIIDYKYEPDIRSEESTLPPFGLITYVLQFVGVAIKVDAFVAEQKIWLFEEVEFGFAGDDDLDKDIIFDTKKDYEDFLSLILQQSQEITGRTLMWHDWRDDLGDDDDDLSETTIDPPPGGELTEAPF